MRILHVIESLGSGGAERQLVCLIKNLPTERFEHVICCLRKPDFFGSGLLAAGHEVVQLDLGTTHPWYRAARSLQTVIARCKPDLVHTRLYDATISTRWAVRGRGRPPVLTSLEAPDYDPGIIRAAGWSPLRKEVLRWIDRASASLTENHFVAVSEFVSETGRRALGIPKERIQVIYNAVNPDDLACAPGASQRVRAELGVPDDAVIFLNVGRLDPQKAHANLLTAFRFVAGSDPRAHLVLVGGGPLDAELRALAQQIGLGHRTHFLGVRKDVGACLEMADVFVMPSLFEGLPVALLEAMFKGLPCLVTRLPVMQEALRDAGVYVTPGAPHELADAMLELLDKPELRGQLGGRARQDAMARFHTDVVVPQWEELYLRLCNAGGGNVRSAVQVSPAGGKDPHIEAAR